MIRLGLYRPLNEHVRESDLRYNTPIIIYSLTSSTFNKFGEFLVACLVEDFISGSNSEKSHEKFIITTQCIHEKNIKFLEEDELTLGMKHKFNSIVRYSAYEDSINISPLTKSKLRSLRLAV